ncbi:hypothetical protein B0T16DRAFT_456988 [Cercophora newfieldiana]|uniref:Uncharacterized protein n=1 Tax=Cercophora newfieldiana TaxID=92897 RepID=A0AA39YDN9_9PEZI|nr:hypothetical protein B0T16DRAFT_456988 [Cercophora newfieldiana]
MSHHDQAQAIPLRDHMISAKAATWILRGIITTGESPNVLDESPDQQQSAKVKDSNPKPATPSPSSAQAAPDMPAIVAMMKEREKAAAKAWREKRAGIRPRTEDEQAYPSKKSKMN